MSPEQAQMTGSSVDTCSDIYSLGVLLYALLVGALPFDPDRLRASGFESVLRTIREVDPPKPSTRLHGLGGDEVVVIAEQRRVGRATAIRVLRGELDWITMKAMDKNPARRYATASEFAADIQRYLDGHPVEAGRGSSVYVLSKMAKRYRAPVTVGVALIAVIITFAVTMTVLHQRAVTAEMRATEVKEFIKTMLASIDPAVAKSRDTRLLREMLDAGAVTIDVELAGQPDARAEMHHLMGLIYLKIGEYDDAAHHLRAALDLRTLLASGDDPDMAESLHYLAWAMTEKAEFDSAMDLYEKALRIRTNLFGERSQQVAATLNDYGVMLDKQGLIERAEPHLRRALDVRLADSRTPPQDVVESLATLGSLLLDKAGPADLDEAERLLHQAIRHSQRELGTHPHTVAVMNKLGLLYKQQRKYHEAEDMFRQALALRRELLGDEHSHVAVSQHNLALALYELGRLDEAIELHRLATSLWSRTLGSDHPDLALGLRSYAMTLRAAGRTREAEAQCREALRIQMNRLGPADLQTADTRYVLARTLMDQGDCTSALRELEESAARFSQSNPDHWKHGRAKAAVGRCLYRIEKHEDAEQRLLSGYSHLARTRGSDDPFTIEAIEWLIELYDASNRDGQAADFRALLKPDAGTVPSGPP